MSLHLPTSPSCSSTLLTQMLRLQLLQQDKVFPSSAQLIYFYFYLENSHYLFLLLALSHFSVFDKNNASSENGATIQNMVPWYTSSIALKTFPFHSSCFVITHLIVFPPLMIPSPLNYQLRQCRNHFCLLFTLYLGPSTVPNTQNTFE